MIIYGGFRWYVVIKMCFYELVEVRNVFSNSYAYCDLLFLPPGPYSRYSLCLEASLISSQECQLFQKRSGVKLILEGYGPYQSLP